MEGLKAWQAKRREESLVAAKRAIVSLSAQNEAINFRSVAAASGLTRKTLYQIPELKALVLKNRNSATPATEQIELIRTQAARIARLESELAALKFSLRQIRQKITQA